MLDNDFYPITYTPVPHYLKNTPIRDRNNLDYIPIDYWMRNSVISSFEALTYYSDVYSERFVYNGRDALSSINISNATFETLNFAFPVKNHITWTEEQLSGTKIQFLGTNKLNITNNNPLTSVDIELSMFDDRVGFPEYNSRNINILNNSQLSSVNIKANITDTSKALSSEAYTNITVSGCNINNFTLTATDDLLYKNSSYITYTTTLADSSKLKRLVFDSNVLDTYITINTSNSILSLFDILSVAPDSYSTYLDYNSWQVLRGGMPFTQYTLSAYNILDFSNLNNSDITAIMSSNTNWATNWYNFTKAPSSTIIDVITSHTSNLHWNFSGPVPVELYFAPQYDLLTKEMYVTTVPTNPNTLYTYQHNILIEPLSGIRQPYTFYRPVSSVRSINNSFKYNKNNTYTWPISVLNNISRMSSYQGPFADSTMPRTFIHSRYAVTADHWNYAKTYPHNFSVFNTTTQTQTTVTALTGKRIGNTDIRVIQLQTPLDVNSFPGMYLVPTTLFKSNSSTKIPPVVPGFAFSQDYDLTVCPMWSPRNSPEGFGRAANFITNDIGGFLSQKGVRTGDSGHPVFTFINNKPVLMQTWTTTGGGPNYWYHYDDILAVINQMDLASGGSGNVALNNITQADLDVYDNYDSYLG